MIRLSGNVQQFNLPLLGKLWILERIELGAFDRNAALNIG
jgi:hypothetical protein